MTKRGVLLVAGLAAVVATSETALYLQLRDTEKARRKLAAHRCPPPFEKDPPASVFARRSYLATAEDPALMDPVDRMLFDQPKEVRGA